MVQGGGMDLGVGTVPEGMARGMDRGYGPGTALELGTVLPPVKRLTDTYENITFPQLPLRAVKMDAHAHS